MCIIVHKKIIHAKSLAVTHSICEAKLTACLIAGEFLDRKFEDDEEAGMIKTANLSGLHDIVKDDANINDTVNAETKVYDGVKNDESSDFSRIQTAAGLSAGRGIAGSLTATPAERETLRMLAARVAELAARPVEQEKRLKWYAHNDMQRAEPLVFIDPENGWNEIITADQLVCRHPLLRVWEMTLRKEIFWAERLRDDRVIEPFFNVPYLYEDTGWGLAETIHGDPEHGGAYIWDAPISDYEADLPKLQFPKIVIDYEGTEKVLNVARELFDGLLTVRLRGTWWWTLGMTCEFIKLRGLTNFMMDMYDHPEGVHQLMSFLRDGTLHRIDFLEQEGLLALNTEGTYVGSGGFGWTSQLPQPDFNPARVRTIDMWGFGESQETVGVSPEMFGEFILPYQVDVLSRFGITCYGCCEPIDSRWEYVKKIPRLRRISSSPWADRRAMAEQLGREYILSVKPNPAFLARPQMAEDEARKELREVLKTARGQGCFTELIMKDNHTLGGNPENAVRWVEIAREEIAREEIDGRRLPAEEAGL